MAAMQAMSLTLVRFSLGWQHWPLQTACNMWTQISSAGGEPVWSVCLPVCFSVCLPVSMYGHIVVFARVLPLPDKTLSNRISSSLHSCSVRHKRGVHVLLSMTQNGVYACGEMNISYYVL